MSCDDTHTVSPTVLIIDDHAAFRAGARELLKADGYEVIGEAGGGASGLAAIAYLRPDVILLDVRLPDMDGFAVAGELRARGCPAAIVVTSSSDDPLYPERAVDSGARGFVAKHDVCGAALDRLLGLNGALLPRPTGERGRLRGMRVVIADDSVLLRAGLARLLEDAGIEVAGQAADAEDLLRKVRAHKPDIAVTDIRMPPTQTDEGLRAAQQIRAEMPEVGVMVLSQFIDEGYALELLQGSAEGVGYLLKDRVADIDAFVDALRRVHGRGSVLDPEVVAQLLGRRRADDPLDRLTPREREVLGQMAQGRSNGAIARDLVVTERAIEKHVTSIFSKLGLSAADDGHRRVLAVLQYLGA